MNKMSEKRKAALNPQARGVVELLEGQQERTEQLEAERSELLAAIKAALNELGMPIGDYPAPVANAWVILKAVLDRAVERGNTRTGA